MMFDAWVVSHETGGYELSCFVGDYEQTQGYQCLHDRGRRGTNNNDDSSVHP